ncbi:MAG TPA: LLM class F420-dependent oxidoreductase [Candidatus Dormibacteraeota bacterium]|nr:LLM class F420-dependent oxidoreductase [Candidatus Dormibacteraeota bacterium]
MQLGRVGIWSGALRRASPGEAVDAAVELDGLGYGTLWLPGRPGPDRDSVFERAESVLAATSRMAVATGIVSVWEYPAATVAAEHNRLADAYPGRFLLGLGISHGPLVDADEPGRYARPIGTMSEYLDELDSAPRPVPRDQRVIAALGPRMLQLARDRSAGTHPYNVTPEHTRIAREAVGPDRLVLPEQAVVLSDDAETARRVARKFLSTYLQLPNYTDNWMRLGFTPEDLELGGSDRLVDALIASGDADAIRRRIDEHRQLGAEHVCIQVLREDGALPRQEWRELASTLVA